jgi:hypothetical protein
VIPEEEVFTMHGFDVFPVFHRLSDGWRRRMLIVIEGDVEVVEDFIEFGIAVHRAFVVISLMT